MKINLMIILVILFSFSSAIAADNEKLQKEIEELKARIHTLEKGKSADEGLKVQDLSNTTLEEGNSSSHGTKKRTKNDAGEAPTLSDQQVKEVMQSIKKLKENKKKHDKELKEINEYFGIKE